VTKLETELTIREFSPRDAAAFRRLNEEWIIRYFALEPKDEASLANPERTILDRGGRIFLAVRDSQPVGCCALLAIAPGEFEIAKMVVTEPFQHCGIGRRLLEKAMREARASGAHRLYLETNQKLVTAIRLYESLGFRHLPRERIVLSAYALPNDLRQPFVCPDRRVLKFPRLLPCWRRSLPLHLPGKSLQKRPRDDAQSKPGELRVLLGSFGESAAV